MSAPLAYGRASDMGEAIAHVGSRGGAAAFLAGGTDMLQLLEERVANPAELIDINALPLASISFKPDRVAIGALARLSDVADTPEIAERFPALVQALRETASPQVRNRATMGGSLLQRTRCLYFRDVTTPCNKREPGSGCSALEGQNRINAVLGGSPHCIAAYPGDLATALVALDAELLVRGPSGERRLSVEELHRLPGDTPHIETVLAPGDLIEAVEVPLSARASRSVYLKVRDRASFEWALASVAVALELEGQVVRNVRIAVGGVATKPWRLHVVEAALAGRVLDADAIALAAERAAEGTQAHGRNAFKIPLLQRLVARALATAGELS